MEATFLNRGDYIDYTPGSLVSAGDVIVQEDLIGIATAPIAANALGALAVTGVFDIAKASGSSAIIAAGSKIYWDADEEVATTTAGDNKYLGKAIKTAGSDDATVRVRLDQ